MLIFWCLKNVGLCIHGMHAGSRAGDSFCSLLHLVLTCVDSAKSEFKVMSCPSDCWVSEPSCFGPWEGAPQDVELFEKPCTRPSESAQMKGPRKP